MDPFDFELKVPFSPLLGAYCTVYESLDLTVLMIDVSFSFLSCQSHSLRPSPFGAFRCSDPVTAVTHAILQRVYGLGNASS